MKKIQLYKCGLIGCYMVMALTLLMGTADAQSIEARALGSFKGVRVGQSVDVILESGSENKMLIEVRGNGMGKVSADIDEGILKIGMRSGGYRGKGAKVKVIYKGELEYIRASSAADIRSENPVRGSRLELNVSSAANMDLEIDVEEVEASASSSGDIILRGHAKVFRVSASSAGDVEAYGLDAKKVIARASSAGDIQVSASESIEARASSAGDIHYRGNPEHFDVRSSSGGSIRKH